MEHKYFNSGRQVFFKSYDMEMEADEPSREVQGYLAAFDNRDMDGDVILKGAFQRSINNRGPQSSTARKIAYLWAHDLKMPVGVFTDLWEDSKGLAFKGKLDATDYGERLMTQYKSGSVNNHSIGFKYMWDKMTMEKDGDEKTFYLKEVNLFEGSATPIGVNENTPYEGKKSLHDDLVILNHDTELFLKSLSPENEYQARQLITKHIALTEANSLDKKHLAESNPQQFDIQTAIKNVKIIL